MSITTIFDKWAYYGIIRYFTADKCTNDCNLQKFNRGKIGAEEFVTFDCGLMEMREILKDNIETSMKFFQILAVIVRPEIEQSYLMNYDKRFEFCGYDLVEISSCISAITNCGAGFEKAIRYEALNNFGLISTYREAVFTQLNLNEEYPDESHAYCEIVEIWRYQTN